MSDMLLEISQRPQVKEVAKALGVPVPPALERAADRPYEELPLQGKRVAVNEGGEAALRALLEGMGAAIEEEAERWDALVFDGRGLKESAGLDALHRFFHERVAKLEKGARLVLLGRPVSEAREASEAAAQAGLEGFMRSVAKELGRRGVTAHLLRCGEGVALTEEVEGALRFLMTPHASYIDGQVFDLKAKSEGFGGPFWGGVLRDKVAVVTGAAQGIGEATARLLHREGAHVVCVDLAAMQERLVKVAGELGGDSLTLDLGSNQAGLRLAAFLKSRHGGADVIVHNAGVTRDRMLVRMKEERWDQVLEVNLRGVERVDRALDEHELLRSGGAQIYLSSIAGIAGNAGQSNYATAKSALLGYVRHRAGALATRGVRANAVAPGFIETRMTQAIPVAIREAGRRMNNLSQGGVPEDVAEAIVFLSSGLGQGLSGERLRVCGGMWLGA